MKGTRWEKRKWVVWWWKVGREGGGGSVSDHAIILSSVVFCCVLLLFLRFCFSGCGNAAANSFEIHRIKILQHFLNFFF